MQTLVVSASTAYLQKEHPLGTVAHFQHAVGGHGAAWSCFWNLPLLETVGQNLLGAWAGKYEIMLMHTQIHYLEQPCSNYVRMAVQAAADIHREDMPGDILIFLTGVHLCHHLGSKRSLQARSSLHLHQSISSDPMVCLLLQFLARAH